MLHRGWFALCDASVQLLGSCLGWFTSRIGDVFHGYGDSIHNTVCSVLLRLNHILVLFFPLTHFNLFISQLYCMDLSHSPPTLFPAAPLVGMQRKDLTRVIVVCTYGCLYLHVHEADTNSIANSSVFLLFTLSS